MSHSPQPHVLIAAEGDWYAVCRFPKIFHRAGVKTTLLVLPRALARRTRYAHKLPLDGAHSVSQVTQTLRAHLATHPGEYQMIIPGDDMTMRALAAEADRDWLRPWFPVDPTPEKLELVLSKAAMVAACEKAGLPCPISIPCQSMEEAVVAAREIGYPVFFKGEESSGGFGVDRADDETALRQIAQKLPERYQRRFSIQKYLTGNVGSTAVFSWHGEAVQWTGSYKFATWPAPYGASTQRKFIRHPDIELMARGVAKITGFHGFFGIDWIESEQTGRCHVIEMNPRPTPQFHLCLPGETDFADGIRHKLNGGPAPAPLSATPSPRTVRMFPQDFFRCLDERDYPGSARWLFELVRPGSDIPWDDRALAIGMIKKFGRYYRSVRQQAKAGI